MAITRSDELRHSPVARDTKSSSWVIAIIIIPKVQITICFTTDATTDLTVPAEPKSIFIYFVLHSRAWKSTKLAAETKKL
jgi:hypothetical protein